MLDVLHWLPLQQRIIFRIGAMVWRCILGRVHRMPMGKKIFLPNQLIRATESCLLIWALKISKLFPKSLMSRALTRGVKLQKIGIFHENRLFSVEIFLYSTTSMLCHPWKDLLTLRRMVNYKNLIIFDEHITTLTLAPISQHVAKTKSVKNS